MPRMSSSLSDVFSTLLGLLVGAILIVIVLGVVLVIVVLTSKEPERRQQRLLEEFERRQAKLAEPTRDPRGAITEIWTELKGYFPYLETPRVPDTKAETLITAVKEVLDTHASWGTIPSLDGVAVPALPESERVKHLYVVGKSGSGKSTFLEHLVRHDMEAGRGIAVMGPEGELFRTRLLNMVPRDREDDVVYFAPADPDNTLVVNPLSVEPGDEPSRAAEDVTALLSRVFGDDGMGRMQVVLSNAVSALMGRSGATLWDVRRLLIDDAFRAQVAHDADPYVRDFWLSTFSEFPKGAALPIVHRLDRFLRPKDLQCLLYPQSSFSVREAIAESKIIFIDLFGLSEMNRRVIGGFLLSTFQYELMRREAGGADTRYFGLYTDEFQSFAGQAATTWRELLSRSRKYGVGLTLANQYPAQLPAEVRQEIFGNAGSIVSFKLGARDANLLRHELLVPGEKGLGPLAAPLLLERSVGEAVMRLGGGHAIVVGTPPPLSVPDALRAQRVIARSRDRYGTTAPPSYPADLTEIVEEPESFFE